MSPHRLIPIVGTGLLAGLLAAIAVRQQQIRALESSVDAVSTAADRTSVPAKSGPRFASTPLSDEEQRELLTLRRQVGEGRRQRSSLESLEAKNRHLHVQISEVTGTGGDSSPVGVYVSPRKARFVGMATPRDTLESFLAAVQQGDTNVLFQLLDADGISSLKNALESRGAKKTLDDLRLLPGFRMRDVANRGREFTYFQVGSRNFDGKELPADSIQVEVEYDPRPGAPADVLPFQRVNGEWRLSLRF